MTSSTQDSHFWVFDTRSMWDGKVIAAAVSPIGHIIGCMLSETTKASEAWPLLSIEEQIKASRYHFLRDAKMSVASSLMKRHFVSTVANVPWNDITFSRLGDAVHGKPSYAPSVGAKPALDFNVSHQAGLVALAGCSTPGVLLGVDIVCVDERNNSRMIEKEGFDAWVDMHAEVFSDEDVTHMKEPAAVGARETSEAKLRRFFAFWALKEAYVKLEGEALLAPWLKDVEFRNVRCPEPTKAGLNTQAAILGDIVTDIEVWFRREKVSDVNMTLQAFEHNYMIASAIKGPSRALSQLPSYKVLHIEDVIRSENNVKS